MYKIEELKEKILLAASTLGMDIDLNGTDLSREEKYALKNELVKGFDVDPLVATFLTITLKDGIDFDWLSMYSCKRSLYQINLGIIQGVDMSFSKKTLFTSLQLEAIRQWSRRGVDMSDLSFESLSHKNIRALAALKQAGCNYIKFVSRRYSAGFLNHYLETYKLLGDIENKEIFLKFGNVINSKKLLKENIDVKKLSQVGFFEASESVHQRLLSQLGIAFLRGDGDKVRWVFDHIELFSLQELLMINEIFKFEDLEAIKMTNENPAMVIFKGLGINDVNGNIKIYEEFFAKDCENYYEDRLMNCIKYGLDMTFLLRYELNSWEASCILNIINAMINNEYGVIYISKVLDIFDKALDLIEDTCTVFKRLNCIVSGLSHFENVDFEVLLDQSIPDLSKTDAIVGKHLKCDSKMVVEMNFSYFRQSQLLEKEIHPDVLSILPLGNTIEHVISDLNENAHLIDILKLDLYNLSGPSINVLAKFNHLKHLPGFYELGHKNFYSKSLFLGLDALELGLDILPVIRHFNGFYAEKVLRDMIENHLGTTNYISHSESECNASNEEECSLF